MTAFALLAVSAQSAPKPFVVVIDPGHGGSDLGATGKYAHQTFYEKDLTLEISKAIVEKLKPAKIRGILTRIDDQNLSLPERTALANRLRADLFVSIHMNSSPDGVHAEGIETYVLNHSSDASSRRLAALENSDNPILTGSIADRVPKTDVALIVKDLVLDANSSSSRHLACILQTRLVSSTARANRGVKEAFFHVLLGADMPSALVEAGFMDNRTDLKMAKSPTGKNRIANAIAGAIREYRDHKQSRFASTNLNSCKVN